MTISKLIQAKEILDANEVATEGRYFVLKGDDMTDLLNTVEATSADYNTIKALYEGTINYFMGFQIIRTELVNTTTSVNDCVAFQKDCVGLAVGRDVVTRVTERPDVSYANQVYLAFSAGSTRIDDAGVVWVQTDHS